MSSATPSDPPLPKFTLKSFLLDIVDGINFVLNDPHAVFLYYFLVVLCESIINKLIVWNVAYTEIDFSTYMEQVRLIKNGVLNYDYVFGESGPLVYPAGFVQIYTLLESFYQEGDLLMIQRIFGYLLNSTFVVYAIVYQVANGTESTPLYKKPWLFAFLLLSKRLHSIYVLRLFNDCFVTFFMGLVILLLQGASYMPNTTSKNVLLYLSSAAFSYAVSIKMNALLYLPGLFYLFYVFHGGRLISVFFHVLVVAAVQIFVAWDFLGFTNFSDPSLVEIREAYLRNAFDFLRKFLYKWTINWKFLPEEVFQSDLFHKGLLAAHILVLFVFVFRWSTNFNPLKAALTSLKNPFKAPFKSNLDGDGKLGAYIFYVMAVSNLVGVLFSRSLHYQFLSWYHFHLPFVYALSGVNYYLLIAVHVAHEICWCTYPSTRNSSLALVGILASLLIGVWGSDYFADFAVLKEVKELFVEERVEENEEVEVIIEKETVVSTVVEEQ